MIKKIIIVFLILISLNACSPYTYAKPSEREVAFDFQNHPELLSDDLDTRFQQLFFYELENPTVDEPFPPPPYSSPENLYGGNGGVGLPSRLFKREIFGKHLLSKGAFFFVEPPNSYLAVGLERCISRGIYDIQVREVKEDGQFSLAAFSMEIELKECFLTDVVLTYHDPYFRLQNQKIPLLVEEKDGILSVTADIDNVTTIMTDLGSDFILRGVITYQGEEYPFSSYI